MEPLNDKNKLQIDEKNNKNWNVWKNLKKYSIMNFETIRYKPTALGNIIQSMVNYEFMSALSILRLPKEKRAKTANSRSFEAIRKWSFQYKLFYFQLLF